MISDGQTPYDQLNVSPDTDQGEIRNSYLQLRKEEDDDTQRRLKAAWELVWSPEQRATIDAFLLQLEDPGISPERIAATVENDKSVLEWSQFLDEESVVRDEVIALKEIFLRSTWLNLPFQHYFQRPAPRLQQPPVPAPTLTPVTYSEVDSQNPFTMPSKGGAQTPQPNVLRQTNDWVGDRLYTAANPLRALWNAIRLALSAPTAPPTSYSAASTKQARLDLTMLYLLVAVVLLFMVLSVSGYFIVRFFFAPDINPLPEVISGWTSRFAAPPIETPNASPAAPPTLIPDPVVSETQEDIGNDDVNQSPIIPLLTRVASEQAATAPGGDGQAGALQSLPAATPVVAPIAIQTTVFANVRSGPGAEYQVLQVISPEQSMQAIGRTAASDWLQVVTGDGVAGWVSALIVTPAGDLSTLPEAPPPPLP